MIYRNNLLVSFVMLSNVTVFILLEAKGITLIRTFE